MKRKNGNIGIIAQNGRLLNLLLGQIMLKSEMLLFVWVFYIDTNLRLHFVKPPKYQNPSISL